MSSNSPQDSVTEEHLRCDKCVYIVNLARLDGKAVLACHCTGVDNEINPVPVDDRDDLPERWQWVPQGPSN